MREGAERLRGRDAELTVLGEALDVLLSGRGVVVVIHGLAGMGKTRLVQEMVGMAPSLSIRVGTGAAEPATTVVQLAPLMEACFGGAESVLDRRSLDASHASPEQRYWLLQDLEELLERAALAAPVLVCLDDLHWADSGTAAALRTLSARLAGVPVGWVVTIRDGSGSVEIRSAVDFLLGAGAIEISLSSLDDGAVAQVASDVLGAKPDRPLLEFIEHAGGNPFLLVELLCGLRDETLVRIEDGKATITRSTMPNRLTLSVRRRLEGLSEQARHVAAVAASLGRRFSLDDLAVILDVMPSTLVLVVEELIDGNIFVERGDRLGFAHDLTFDAVRASVPNTVRRALDRQAAGVLLDRGALPIEVAMQLAASAEPGDEIAITTLLKAAQALGPTDPGSAADLSQRAIELAPAHHPLRGPLVAGVAVWLHASGRTGDAKAFADTALEQVLPSLQQAEVRLSVANMFSISPDTRAESSRQALAISGLPPHLRVRHLAVLSHNLVVAGRTDAACEALDTARSAVEASDDLPARFILEVAESGLAYANGEFNTALAFVESALRSSIDAGDDTRAHLARQWQCDILAMLDQVERALALARDHVAAAQRHRHAWGLQNSEKVHARLLLQAGRLADAAAMLRDRYAPDAGDQVVSIPDASALGALARIAIHLGDDAQIRQTAKIAQVMVEHGAPSVRRHGAWVLALQAAARNDPVRAHQCLCLLGAEERRSILPLFPGDVSDEARLVRMAQSTDDEDLAAHAVTAAEHRALRNPEVTCHRAAAAHARGLLDRSVADLTTAVKLYESGSRPLSLAAALEDLGAVAIDGGASEEAIDAFSKALVIFANTGATSDTRRLRGRLRALGVRRRLVATQRPERGWAAMTNSELAVARLISQGLTNREVAERLFVSLHTVSGHLRSIYAKLDINSRAELGRLAAHLDPPA